MNHRNDLNSAASRFAVVSPEEMLQVEGGLSWGDIWGAIKGAATWVKDHVFVDFGKWVIGYKGTF